jgi:putative chitinase
MITLDAERLRKLAPPPSGASRRQTYDAYIACLVSPEAAALLDKYGVETHLQGLHFLAQITHETGDFTVQAEDGSYSAPRIVEIFGVGHHSAKITAAEAKGLAHNAKGLFERTYGLGNPKKARELGNTDPGDGFKFRGRGPMQTTGRGDYEKLSEHLGLDLVANPDLLNEPIVGLEAALWEWRAKGCNRWADADNIEMVTRLINGGHTNMEDREAHLTRAKTLWDHDDGKPADPNLLNPGASGPLVETLQKHLIRLGYYTLQVDGDFGDRTSEALLAFKHKNNLSLSTTVDGEVWAAFKMAVPRDLGQRAQIDEQDLREKGSTQIADADVAALVGKVTTYGGGGVLAADKLGLVDGLKAVSGNADQFKSFLSALEMIMKMVSTNILPLAVIALGLGLVWYAKRNTDRRVAEARSGAHLGR